MSVISIDQARLDKLRHRVGPVIESAFHILVKLLLDDRVNEAEHPHIELFLKTLLHPEIWNEHKEGYLELNLIHEFHGATDEWHSLSLIIEELQFTIAIAGISSKGNEMIDGYLTPLWVTDGNLKVLDGYESEYVMSTMYEHIEKFEIVGEMNVFNYFDASCHPAY